MIAINEKSLKQPAHSDPIFNGSLFWSIKSKHSAVSFLWGSLHHIDTSKIVLPLPALDDLMNTTDTLIVEVDTERIEDEQSEHLLASENAYFDYSLLLNKPYLEKLLHICKEQPDSLLASVPIESVSPEVMTLLVSAQKEMKSKLYGTPNLQIESRYIQRARKAKKPVIELETVEEQLQAALTSNDLSKQIEELKTAIDSYDADTPDVYARYAQQDLRLLNTKEFFQHAMIQRNKTMVQRLIPHLQRQSAFIIIGAAHLPYSTGVLALLAEAGYQITPCALPVGQG
ncbi:TraB/GumN family protein [Corynebacterium ulcerans]|uniref:TraB/GumN family protein n=1 Tax=Corynebacterium ulcerans TaxID=65058 RepID=UPI0018D81857|nr:TraB/GumN family protein [Corynebacterium ulcerans]MBH5295563.1 TraB/GumN family protein [Corynebacterium ulcerans]MDK8889365.1 TraB/GumN family protein [Corynebacterium ulcerans]